MKAELLVVESMLDRMIAALTIAGEQVRAGKVTRIAAQVGGERLARPLALDVEQTLVDRIDENRPPDSVIARVFRRDLPNEEAQVFYCVVEDFIK